MAGNVRSLAGMANPVVQERIAKPPPRRSVAVVRLGLLGALLFAAIVVAWRLGWFDYRKAISLVLTMRKGRDLPGAMPIFALALGAAAAAGFPTTPLLLAGGAIFGTVKGTVVNWIGGAIGASIGYFLSRSVGRGAICRLLGRRAGLLDRVKGTGGFLAVLRLRLIPLFPQGIVNFGAGLAGVRFGLYLGATLLGLLPTAIIYSYFADSFLSGMEGVRRGALLHLVMACALLLGLSFVPTLAKRMLGGGEEE